MNDELSHMQRLASVFRKAAFNPRLPMTLGKIADGIALDDLPAGDLKSLLTWVDELENTLNGPVAAADLKNFHPAKYRKKRERSRRAFFKQLAILRDKLIFAVQNGIGSDE